MSSTPRLLTPHSALFLDFDGTLVDIAPRPDAVDIHHELPDLLVRLHQRLGGALALITGRAQDDIEPMLAPELNSLPAAYEHGAVRRRADQTLTVAPPPALDRALAAGGFLTPATQTQMFASRHDGHACSWVLQTITGRPCTHRVSR